MKRIEVAGAGGEGARAISQLVLGCSRIGSFNNRTPTAELRKLIGEALDLGVNAFDTANVYGQGDSERELGRTLKSRRDEVFLITKVGKRFSAKMRALRPFKPLLKAVLQRAESQQLVSERRGSEITADFRAETVPAAVEASLRRLGGLQIDALLLHSPPAQALGDPALAEILVKLKAQGKIGAFGVSCDDRESTEAALKIPGLSLLELPLPLIAELSLVRGGTSLPVSGVTVIAREIIRFQPGVPAPRAIQGAASSRGVDAVVLGTSRLAHLREAVAALS